MTRRRAHIPTGPSTSVGVHLAVITLLLITVRHHPVTLRPLRMPGTLQGQHMMLSWNVGAPLESKQTGLLQSHAAKAPKPKLTHSSLAPTPVPAFAPMSETGHGTSGDSALGDENVRVALPQIHPRPKPDLSALPHGTAGDVIVDVVIDDSGKVTGTTLVKGLGDGIDTTVVQALRDWTFTPATRNGQNIASEQEILIHYERG